jgi:DNA mismatch repair protein MutL
MSNQKRPAVSDVIQLLPDSVANQIAAGEVIQRPASVVKELVENSLDSGAGELIIHIKDAGKTLIQITDNGCGMSPSDARMAFERHATSKIREASDLFAIRTLGFRGEALASVAAIADIEMRTRRFEDETGTFLHIIATNVITQEPVACKQGTTIQVKNLFFNVPARRKFLKSESYELKNIITEVQRVAIPNPEIAFQLFHNNTLLFDLPSGNLMKRITGIFGKNIPQSLIPVHSSTTVVTISGFTGLPKYARKTMGEQFFFVNRRFMRHPWFHKAVMQAYEKLLPMDAFPSYFLFLEVDPGSIDINVHPTKTEIKFEDENIIWQIIHAAVRETLGKNSIVPSIDFDQEGSLEIPIPPRQGSVVPEPMIFLRPEYNPFNISESTEFAPDPSTWRERSVPHNWERLYEGETPTPSLFRQNTENQEQGTSQQDSSSLQTGRKVLQLKQKYLIFPVKSGMMVIDQRRARERILFEQFLEILKTNQVASQQILFPHTFELNGADAEMLKELLPDLSALGFEIREFGKHTFIINGVPGMLETGSPVSIVEKLLEEYKNSPLNAKNRMREQIAGSLAKASSYNFGEELLPHEMEHLVDQLFACSSPNFTHDGKTVLTIIPMEEIDKYFAR